MAGKSAHLITGIRRINNRYLKVLGYRKKGLKRMMKVTIKEVAKLAGVSIATVSHVANNSRFVSDQAKSAVLSAMEQLDYQPNAVAKSLRQKTTKTIGLIISDISNPFFTNLVRGVEDVANKKGFNLILCNTDEQSQKEKTYLDVLSQKQVDGIIVAPTNDNGVLFHDLVHKKFPLVFVDRYLEDMAIPAVISDSEDAAYLAVKHLIQLGHTRIGLANSLPSIQTTNDRIKGYRRALTEFGIPYDPKLVHQGDSKVDGGYKGGNKLLQLANPPTAIFATNNLTTIGVMKALQHAGVQCPEQMAVVGFDDFEWASAFRPNLTTVAQPVYDLGKIAAQMLVNLLLKKGKVPVPEITKLKCSLIVRESCGSALPRPLRANTNN
jgi:LacI family transcriptional regulator